MKRLVYIVLVLMTTAGLVVMGRAFAGENTAMIGVSARVLSYMTKSVINRAETLSISLEDIEKGYIDVKNATAIAVKTNSREGYMLSFGTINGPFTGMTVFDSGRSTVVSIGGGLVYNPTDGRIAPSEKLLSYRFYLSKDTAHGSYAWPVMVDVVAN
ncbi:MAG TPA: hypothetical protein VI914_00325 [Thermodesulfobacteriota bacterium]|nr:hypothetical protein [Thermodesulfobacteriota bacterium]